MEAECFSKGTIWGSSDIGSLWPLITLRSLFLAPRLTAQMGSGGRELTSAGRTVGRGRVTHEPGGDQVTQRVTSHKPKDMSL